MIIPFDRKYKPEIESGKYQVFVGEAPARVVYWDLNDGKMIVSIQSNGKEKQVIFRKDGTRGSLFKKKLIIKNNEPDLNEYERAVQKIIPIFDEAKIREIATALLPIVDKELTRVNGVNQKAYRDGIAEGKAQAMTSIPKWRRVKKDMGFRKAIYYLLKSKDGGIAYIFSNKVQKDGYMLTISDLENLPFVK